MGENEKALQFYQKHGFYQIGTHYFVMGQEKKQIMCYEKTYSHIYPLF